MKKTLVYLLFVLLFSPLLVSAATDTNASSKTSSNANASSSASSNSSSANYKFKRDGIFQCNPNGAYAMSVGATSAIGGTFVPVADATVELNTGLLVYKECILREIIDKERENMLASYLAQAYNAIRTGRNGNPLYVKNLSAEENNIADREFAYGVLKGPTLQKLNPALKTSVTRAVAADYYNRAYNQPDSLACPYKGDLQAWWSGQTPYTSQNAWLASQPMCNSVIAALQAQHDAYARVAAALQNQQLQWEWGHGFYSVTNGNNVQDPLTTDTLTPSSVVFNSFNQLLQSPVQQLQNANDLGQMINGLYAGITQQVVSNANGLAGIGEPIGGSPSYLDQMATQISAEVRNTANNIGLQTLIAAQKLQQEFVDAVQGEVDQISGAKSQLQNAETQCWSHIIDKLCAKQPASNGTCKTASTTPQTLKVATSTVFSDAVISSQIGSQGTTYDKTLTNAKQELTIINQLITGFTSSSKSAQQAALDKVDTMVSNHELKSPQDVSNVQGQLSSLKSNISTLLDNTVKDWANGTPNGSSFGANNQTGWCNYNNKTTLDTWKKDWLQ